MFDAGILTGRVNLHKNVTGLTFAAYIGNKDVVRWFLAKNANPNAKTHLGWRPVHFASKRGHVATVDMLIQQGADVNVYTKENETPLMLAQQSRMWDTVRKLKQLGATDGEKSDDFSMRSGSVRDSDNRRKKNLPKSASQGARSSVSRSHGANAHPVCALIKHLQYQNRPYDIDLSRQKAEFISQMLDLPSPFSNRHSTQFYKYLKKLTAANIAHNIRVSAAREIIEVIKSAGSKSQRPNANDTAQRSSRSVESCLRALELAVCERHCSSELISLIADIVVRLVVMFGPYEQSENASDLSNVSVIAYVARLVQRLCGNHSWQYGAGILSLINSIVSKYPQNTQFSTNRDSQLVVSLISDLVTFTDSLDQVENVSRLASFISIIGDYNPTDFGHRFSDFADILVGWCVDSSDTHHSVALGSLLNQITVNFSKWWFDASGEFEVSHSTCDMLSHLIEDAENSLRESLAEHHRFSTAHGSRRSQQIIPQNDISQNLIAAKLYFSVLAGICSSILGYAAQSSPPGQVSLTFLNQSEWHNRLISILQTLSMLTSVTSIKSAYSSASRTLIPPSYCISLLTYGEILRHIHEILQFTESTIPLEEDYIGLNIDAFLIQSQAGSILQTSSQHAKILCELAYNLLKRTSSRSHDEMIETFQALFGPGTLLYRLKTSSCGSLEVLNLLLKLVENCDLLVPVVDMCVSDLKFVCSKISEAERPDNSYDDLHVLFSISLFNAVWRSFSDQTEQVISLNNAIVKIFSNLAELRLRTHLFQVISQRIRLAFWSLVLLTLKHGTDGASDWLKDLMSVTDELMKTASLNAQELVLINCFLKVVDGTLQTNISRSLNSYLLRLAKDPRSPMRANYGEHFCEALGHLIRLWNGRRVNEDILKLTNLCVNHPLPRIQARGADLLLIFGPSLKYLKSSHIKNSLLYWYLNTDIETSTSLISAPSSEDVNSEAIEDILLQHGAFPSVSGAAGLFSIVTRGVAPSHTNSAGFNLLEHSADYLRRLACLVAPFQADTSGGNWLAEDTSSMTIISQFTSSSIADNKLRVTPWVNPINTFLSVEGTIHALLANLTGRSKNYDYAKDLKAFFDIPNNILGRQSLVQQLTQAGALLTFLRSLEKAIMNGVDGYAAAIPPSPLSTHVFLRANSITCRKWFNRIRVPLATLSSWISALSLHGMEAPTTVVWNVYCIFNQTPNANPQEIFSALAFLDNPEKIILLLIQALHQLRAADDLELVYAYLERLTLNASNSEMHIFSWIRGLVQILRGCLDEGLICLFDFFEAYPDSPPTGSLGALSYEFARRIFINLLVRVGGSKLQLNTKKAEFSEACSNQGDTPPTKLRVIGKNSERFRSGKRGTASDGLLFRQPDVAKHRIKALQKLSSWDNSISSMPKPSEALASFASEQENRLLSCPSTSILDVIRAVRHTAAAVIPLVELANNHSECSSLHLDAESSLQTLALEADLLVNKSPTPWPAVIDIGLGTWSLITQKDGNPSVFLDACEPLLIPDNGNSLPTDRSRGVALSLLRQQLKAMGITDDLNDYNDLVNSINARVDLHPDDRLRFIRYVANLLWTSKEGDIKSCRIAAMRCLSEGLMRNITASDYNWSDELSNHCLLNASVALQLFKCLSYPSSNSSSSKEARNMCHEVFDSFTSKLVGRINDASHLVENLRLFGQMASVPWASGMPSRIPVSTEDNGHSLEDFSPSELQMRLLMFATNISLSNASASAWLEMAHWCYERGQSEVKQTKTEAKRVLELPKSEVVTTPILDSLTLEDRNSLSRLMPPEAKREDVSLEARIVAKIYTFLDKTSDGFRSSRFCIEDLSDPDGSLSGELKDTFMEYLTEGTDLTDETLTLDGHLTAECVSLAAALTSRLYALQSISAQAYVTFLAVAGRRFVGGSTREQIRPLNSTRAALRLLSLLNEPSRPLRETVAGLITHGIIKNSSTSLISDSIDSHTNSIVWTGCLPQILDRLGHPDPSVRQCLLDLLSRLIRTTKSTSSNNDRVLAKHLVYPALVGCRGVDYAQSEAKVESHMRLVSALVDAGYSSMVDQVSAFIAEMRRITILWDELWFGVLTQHVDDFNKGLTALDQEIDSDGKPLTHPADIQKLRCEALLAPTFSIFEQLHALTLDVPAETPNEFWFQNTYGRHIEEALKTLKQFCTSQPPDDNRRLVEPLLNLLTRFQMLNQDPKKGEYQEDEDEEQKKENRASAEKAKRRIHMSISNRSLNLSEISPTLLALNDKSSIPLPGRAQSHLIHIAPSISVYPTKTRPKRLTFLNQKGQSFPYLLKCLEDLRLDERIMGLMRLTNIAFSSNGLPTPSTTQTYSITPIGPKAGLIQMVQGAVPLFTLYKRWQQRVVTDSIIDETKDASEFVVPLRPSDLFYRKLKEHLPEHLANTNSRQFWTKEVLLKILKDLESQTPQDLMTRELWAASPNLSSWWKVHQTYATSLGVTSAFGYLIGLGDRHLDNLLIDLPTGRLIHIDFNVSFDEGRSLRVPELVPFRFTRILRHALGPFSYLSVDCGGTFGSSFVGTLRTCRSIQELFHMHLQSFEIDPLSNWMRATSSGVSWSSFDLAYFAAFRGGCLPTSPGCQGQITKRRRVLNRLAAEAERAVGLMAARLSALGFEDAPWQTKLVSDLNMLAENLKKWEICYEKQKEVDQVMQQLTVLKSKSEGKAQLVAFERRCIEVENANKQMRSAMEHIDSFTNDLTVSVDGNLDLLNEWLNQTFENANTTLSKLISEYHKNAQVYITPEGSRLHFSRGNTSWFITKRNIVSALKQAVQTPNVMVSFKKLYNQVSNPRPDASFSASLHNAQIEAQANVDALKNQHFIPSSFEHNALFTIADQFHTNLVSFIHEHELGIIQAAYNLSLIRNLVTWISAMFAPQPMAHIDVLYQHTATMACSFSILDPSGSTIGLPFWAGKEADANSELQFFCTVHHLIEQIVDLRNSLCHGLLSTLESVLRKASESDLQLLNQIQDVVNSSDSALLLQQEMNRLVMGDSNNPLAEVFRQIHVTLSTATTEMENSCQTLANYPIIASTWIHVDWIAQAIAPLESRCTADVGATSLWGWRPNNGQGVLTTWLDEVYRAGLVVVLKVATEISRLWIDIRNGKQQYAIPSSPYAIVLEMEFINNLSDRLALVSEAALASSRMLLALFEASGISVRQALMEQQSMLPLMNMGVPSTVHTLRLHQMAEAYARMNAPEVLLVSSMADSLLAGVFSTISSHICTSIIARELEASELHLNLIRDACRTFEWLHDYQDDSVTSLRNYLTRLKNCVDSVMESDVSANPETKRLCDIATAICSAESSRLGDTEDLKKAVSLLTEYTTLCERYHQLENGLTPTDKVLLALKSDFKLSWPATKWPNAPMPGTKVSSLVEALSARMKEVNQDLVDLGKIIDSTTLALADKSIVSSNGDVTSCELVCKALLDFEEKFLSEMIPYVRQLERFSKLCNDHECGRVWSQWLENYEIWKATSSRLVKNLTGLISAVTLANNKKKTTVTSVLSALKDCQQLGDHLIPSFKTLLESGVWTVLKRSKPTDIISTLKKLGFADCKVENFEVIESLPSNGSLPQESISPQAILAMRRLYGRLQGVDDYLTRREGGEVSAVLSLTDQANLCIRAAVDPNNLAGMFEGWTPWV
ncbi:hypothetical protein Aperf_G00000010963 [Anoplocephala perfoliata]